MTPRPLAMVAHSRPVAPEPLSRRLAALCVRLRAAIASEGADAAGANVEPWQRVTRGARVERMRARLAEAEGWAALAERCERG